MKIVIDIPEGLKDTFENGNVTALDVEEMKNALMNGIPLPKGHGRIGDLDRLYQVFEKNVVSASAFKELFDIAPTIIEADKEEEKDLRSEKYAKLRESEIFFKQEPNL